MKTKASSKRNRSRSSTKKRAAETMPKPDKESRGGGDKERGRKADGEAGLEDKETMPKPDKETMPKPDKETRGGGGKERVRRRKRKRKVVGPSKQDNQVELDPVDLAFAEAEVKERAARGWSIDEVAERATVKRGTIQHVEHHRRGISLRLANRIAKAYDHTLGTFLDLSGKVFSTLLEGVLALGMA
jgi:ribosome-binding protein aMBF1 (putative translation factor)